MEYVYVIIEETGDSYEKSYFVLGAFLTIDNAKKYVEKYCEDWTEDDLNKVYINVYNGDKKIKSIIPKINCEIKTIRNVEVKWGD